MVFWQIPKIAIDHHSDLEKLIVCPIAKAIISAITPDKKNREDNSKKGGASNIDILADVNALDHKKANEIPRIKSRILMGKKRLPISVAKLLNDKTLL